MPLIIAGEPVIINDLREFDLDEVMYYLYLPVAIEDMRDIRLPANLQCCWRMVCSAIKDAHFLGREYTYVYLSARKGWATRDNPLNRPGWHCDGFGTNDLNYVWWKGAGTRFTTQVLRNISEDHNISMQQFEEKIDLSRVYSPTAGYLYRIEPDCVHATPVMQEPGWRQFVKVSLSNHRYNLENNSHNYLFDYKWKLESRTDTRNDTDKAQRDYS